VRSRLCLAVALLAAAPAQGAAGPRVWVVSLRAPPQLTYTGKSAGEVIAREAQRLGGFQVLGPEAVEKKLGRAAYLRLVDCGDDARCLAEAARPLGAERLVGGVLRLTETAYQVSVVLADAASARAVASFAREVPIAARRLNADVAAATPALLRGEADAAGTLVVTSEVPDVEVSVDGEPAGKTPLMVKLRPGKHQVQVSRQGYMPQEPHWVDVAPGQTARDEVRLYADPSLGSR
jgi:hypothetical protein